MAAKPKPPKVDAGTVFTMTGARRGAPLTPAQRGGVVAGAARRQSRALRAEYGVSDFSSLIAKLPTRAEHDGRITNPRDEAREWSAKHQAALRDDLATGDAEANARRNQAAGRLIGLFGAFGYHPDEYADGRPRPRTGRRSLNLYRLFGY